MRLLRQLIKVRLLTLRGICLFSGSLLKEGKNLMAVLRFSAKMFPEKAAVTDEAGTLTYAELYEQSRKLAFLLHERSLAQGQNVAILCRNHRMAVVALFALSRLGANVFLLNADRSAGQLQELADIYRFALLICDEDSPGLTVAERLTVTVLEDLLKQEPAVQKVPRSKAGALIVLSGGTSGKLKQAERRPAATAFLYPFAALLKRIRIGDFRSVYVAAPIYHGYGLAALIVSLLIGKHIFLQRRFDAGKAAAWIHEHRIEVLVLVPLMLQRLVEHNTKSLGSVQRILSGGALLSERLINETHSAGGLQLYNLYGTSEAGFAVLATSEDLLRHPSAIGRRIKGVSLAVLDPSGNKVPVGQTGMLHIKSSWIMDNHPGQWVATGDLVYENKEGYLFLRGRADSMIVSGGENVYPEDVEKILLLNPAIAQVAVTGIKDPEFGKRLHAFVVTKQPAAVNENDLIEWLKGKAARYQLPAKLTIVPDLPVMENGKIDRNRLGLP